MAHPSSEIAFLSLAEAADLIKSGQLSPVELTQAMLERIAALDSQVHAYVTVFAEEALAGAKQAEEQIRAGDYKGPLHGIPLAVKDIKDIYEAGRTTGGSKLRKDYTAAQDCTTVAKLKEAGGLLLGKLATYEFAAGLPTLSSHFQPARNPWNLAFDPGGRAVVQARPWPPE